METPRGDPRLVYRRRKPDLNLEHRVEGAVQQHANNDGDRPSHHRRPDFVTPHEVEAYGPEEQEQQNDSRGVLVPG